MKHFVCLFALCLVAAQALPDGLFKLDPGTITKTLEEAAATLTTSEAPVEHSTTLAPATDPTTPTADLPEVKTSTESKIKSQGTTADRTRLVTDLFKDYNKRVNPDDVKLVFGATLLDLHVLEKEDALETHIWLTYNWTDQRLTWNPEEYGGVEIMRLKSGQVWKPDVTLYNSADPVNMVHCHETNVLLYSTGKIMWIPPCKMTSMCHLNLRREPYGENTCTLKFGSWTYDGNTLDLQLNNSSMEVSEFTNTSGFELVGNVAEREDKYYPCCAEPYPNVQFNLTLKRIPGEELFKRL